MLTHHLVRWEPVIAFVGVLTSNWLDRGSLTPAAAPVVNQLWRAIS